MRNSRRGFDAAALLASERAARARCSRCSANPEAEIRRGVDTALLDAGTRTRSGSIAGKAELQTRLLNGKHTDAEAAATEKELDALTAEFEQVQSRIRQTSPQYAALTQPAPLDLKEIQTKVLERTRCCWNTRWAQKSFLWVVTPSSMDTFELPPRAEIESAARRVYELLTARNQRAGEGNAGGEIGARAAGR